MCCTKTNGQISLFLYTLDSMWWYKKPGLLPLWVEEGDTLLLTVTLPNADRFSKFFFHCQTYKFTCNKVVINDTLNMSIHPPCEIFSNLLTQSDEWPSSNAPPYVYFVITFLGLVFIKFWHIQHQYNHPLSDWIFIQCLCGFEDVQCRSRSFNKHKQTVTVT